MVKVLLYIVNRVRGERMGGGGDVLRWGRGEVRSGKKLLCIMLYLFCGLESFLATFSYSAFVSETNKNHIQEAEFRGPNTP